MRGYIIVSAVVFSIVALVNIVRMVAGWPIQIGACSVPTAASWVPVIVTGSLATWATVVAARQHRRAGL